jgi:hypothetical protein
MGLILVLAIRLTVPLTILRWPFQGSLLTIAADTTDLIVFGLTDFPSLEYQRLDKLLDVYYIILQATVAQRWRSPARWTANGLLVYRMLGTLLYEVSGVRVLLFVFPNIFTFFFIWCAGAMALNPGYELTPRRTAASVAVVFVPTMFLEYALHYRRWFDDLVAVDVIADAWSAVVNWLQDVLP